MAEDKEVNFMTAKVEKNFETSKDSLEKVTGTLRKRNKFKWFGYHLAHLLYYQNPQSVLRSSYENSFHCCDEMYQLDGKITSKYCKNRWCPQCQRIRMGTLINAYSPRLEQEEKLYFITLTRPNVKAEQLKEEIQEYQVLWRKIQNRKFFKNATKGGMIGIRKLECTYHATKVLLEKHEEWRVNLEGKKYKKVWFTPTNEPDPWYDTYHPHLHILVNDEQTAIRIKAAWLELNPCANPGAQLLVRVTDTRKQNEDGTEGVAKGYLEIFKYFTKLIAKDSNGKRFFDAKHMNVIFEAMNKKRVYFRIGTPETWQCEEVNEENTEEEAALFVGDYEAKTFRWVDAEEFFGYYDIDSGEALTEMKPPSHLMQVLNHKEGD